MKFFSFFKKKEDEKPLYYNRAIDQNMQRGFANWERADKNISRIRRRKQRGLLVGAIGSIMVIALALLVYTNKDLIATKAVAIFHPETSEAVISVTESSSADETPTDCTALTVSIDDSVDSVDVKIGPADGQKFQSGWCYVIAEEDQAKWLDLFRTSGDIKEFAKILAAESGVDLNTAIDALKDSKSSFILDLR